MNSNEEVFIKNRKKIINILRHAYKSKYYKKIILESGIILNDDLTYEDFTKIPTTNKNIYKVNKFDMVTYDLDDFQEEYFESLATGFEKEEYLKKYNISYRMTSGSTGQPLDVLKSFNDNKKDYIMLNYYRRKLTDYDFKGKFIWIFPVNPVTRKIYTEDKNASLGRKVNNKGYMFSLYEYSESNLLKLYNFIVENNFEWITSSPTALYKLAEVIEKNKLKRIKFKYIECHSEYLFDWQSEKINDVFGVIPTSIYSCNEVQFIGAMCKNKKNHLFEKSAYVEFIENSHGSKDIYITSLNYSDIPIIRYRVGDCGEWDNSEDLNCNMEGLPTFRLNKYRSNDFIVTKDNVLIEPYVIMDSIYYLSNKFSIDIKKFKIKQVNYDSFEFYFEHDLIEKSCGRYEKILSDVLSEFLNYNVKIILSEFDFDKLQQNTTKYKCFESCVKIKKQ